MDAYSHITPIERSCIMTLFNQGHSPAAIATMLKRHRCTILRELKRNSDGESYDASKAQEKYDSRRKLCRRKRELDDPELFALVKERFLKLHWSPEQIQYRSRHEGRPHVISYATIYRGIYAKRFNDPDWVISGKQRLRHRGKKRRRRGDWEADTVAGVVGGAVLLTLVDRKSRYLRCVRLEKKTADGVNAAMIEALRGQTVHSITPDRGKEFARHAVVAEALGIKIYIPPPYQPWQRGTNENTDGLLREYFPKHQDIAQYPDDYIEKAVLALNNRPRKCLQWRTPYEVYFDEVLHLV